MTIDEAIQKIAELEALLIDTHGCLDQALVSLSRTSVEYDFKAGGRMLDVLMANKKAIPSLVISIPGSEEVPLPDVE